MIFLQALTTIFEIVMVATLFWCFFHEDSLIAFERRLLANIKRRKLRVVHTAYQQAKTVRQ